MAQRADRVTPNGESRGLPVSVAVCTRNRERQLARALQSLLEVRPEIPEIVVVDNAPDTPRTRALVTGSFPRVRYVEEPVEGLDFARNRAVEESGGQIVAFLDDDAVASPGWLEPLVAAFGRDPRLALCFGRVEAFSLASPGARLFEANGGFGRGNEPIDLPDPSRRVLGVLPLPVAASIVKVGSGCSMAVRRSALDAIGGFDTALDMGRELPGGGDLDVIWRFLDAGFRVRYEPSSLANHEHREDEAATIDQIIEHNRSLIATLVKMITRTRGSTRAGAVVFLAWRLLKPGVRVIRRLGGRDPLPMGSLLRLWWGSLRGLTAYRTARKISGARSFHASIGQ